MRCLQQHEKTALIFKDQQIGYAQLLEKIQKYAALFQTDQCDKVAIYSENRLEWVYAFYAAWRNRCMAVPIDFMATAEEVAYMLNDCKPEVIFCSREKAQDAKAALQLVSYAPKLLVFEELEETLRAVVTPRHDDFLERDAAETALIIYTSGTTGSPKGAMLSFDNLLANLESVAQDVPIYTRDQRVLVLLPLHHIFPLLGTIVIVLYVGGTCVFSPSMASEDLLGTLQQHGVTMIVAVPRFYNLIRKGIKDKIDRSAVTRTLFKLAETVDSPAFSKLLFKTVHQKFGGKIQYLVCGGAAIENEVARDFKTLGFDLLAGYGMTEAAPMISFTHPGTLRIGASGYPLPKNEVKIVEEEILAKGRNIMPGYYHRPEETAAVIQDGWLHTGDLGHLDDEGYLFVTGRKKDIIVLPNGKNINPEEIESKILKQFDTVKEIGVFLHENILQAVIYPDFQKLHERGAHQIGQFMRWDVLDKYNHAASPAKKITKFTIVKNELPKTRLGKIRRFQLPALVASDASDRPHQAEPDYPEYQMIKDFLSEQTGQAIYADQHLEIDLGLDSLDKVSLLTFLHATFGVEMQDEEINQRLTIGKIAEYIREKKVKMDVEGVNWRKMLHEPVQMVLPTSAVTHVPSIKLLRFLLSGYFNLTATGLEHLPKTSCIFVVNHQSYLDGLVLTRFFDARLVKQTYFYADERHFRKSWQQLFAAKHNVIIVNINRQLKLSLQKMAAVLNSGKNMVIFPEGARTRDGQLGEFKKTFAILSCELQIPIVPVVLQGAYEAMPIGKVIPKFRQAIQVAFLPPILPENLSYEALTDKVYQCIKRHLSP
jgi:long-chain acyl-CoA synthetase